MSDRQTVVIDGKPARYVCGFAFTNCLRYVLLIKKTRPQWQAGKLNGIGGKIDPGETPAQAMARESIEETGVGFGWESTIRLHNQHEDSNLKDAHGFEVFFFRAVAPEVIIGPLNHRPSEHGEELIVCPVDCCQDTWPHRQSAWLKNLHWLIPMHVDLTLFNSGDKISEH